jgi:hypothetical protein
MPTTVPRPPEGPFSRYNEQPPEEEHDLNKHPVAASRGLAMGLAISLIIVIVIAGWWWFA